MALLNVKNLKFKPWKSSTTGMKKHVKEIHGKDLNKVESSDLAKPYKCGACSEEFETSDELYNHLKVIY